MIGLPPGTKVFLACRPIDLRAGFDGLACLVPGCAGLGLPRPHAADWHAVRRPME
jgi:hypothetical protein